MTKTPAQLDREIAEALDSGKQSPIRYLAITTTKGDKFILRVLRDVAGGVAGIEVDREGDEVVPRGVNAEGLPYHTRTRIVPRDGIKKSVEMRMNVMYGRLERAK
jgi:hypothetical protein